MHRGVAHNTFDLGQSFLAADALCSTHELLKFIASILSPVIVRGFFYGVFNPEVAE